MTEKKMKKMDTKIMALAMARASCLRLLQVADQINLQIAIEEDLNYATTLTDHVLKR